jgi:hypothetical protein
MAMTAYLDVDQGSDFTAMIDLENDDGTPMNLVGTQIYSQFRKSFNSTTSYAFTCAIEDALHGKFSLKLPGTTSSSIKPGRYLYDVEVYNAVSGSKNRVVEGVLTINPEITKIP